MRVVCSGFCWACIRVVLVVTWAVFALYSGSAVCAAICFLGVARRSSRKHDCCHRGHPSRASPPPPLPPPLATTGYSQQFLGIASERSWIGTRVVCGLCWGCVAVVLVVRGLCAGCAGVVRVVQGLCVGCVRVVRVVRGLCFDCAGVVRVVPGLCMGCVGVVLGQCGLSPLVLGLSVFHVWFVGVRLRLCLGFVRVVHQVLG